MKRKKRLKKQNSERWLLTYSDLITLLFVLFVILYAISNADQKKYEAVAKSMNQSFGDGSLSKSNGSGGTGIFDGGNSLVGDLGGNDDKSSDSESSETTTNASATKESSEEITKDKSQISETSSEAQTENSDKGGNQTSGEGSSKLQIENLQNEVNSMLKNVVSENDEVSTNISSGSLIVSFIDEAGFDSCKADINTILKEALNRIGPMLENTTNEIVIEGHTDNVPVVDNIYASNWQLSAVRAANVAEYLCKHFSIEGTRISASGYGEYHPIGDNSTDSGRKENRRIDIIIKPEK